MPAQYNLSPWSGQSPCRAIPGVSPNSCPNCRDVPDSDIDSARTSWQCFCGGCETNHKQQCERRRIIRTISRLISLQEEIAKVFRAELSMVVHYAFRDEPRRGGVDGRIIYYTHGERPTHQDAPFGLGLKEEVKAQACSVDFCVGAISCTSPILAWLTEGLSLKLHEVHVLPRPLKQIVTQAYLCPEYDRPALLHTVLALTPNTEDDQNSDGGWKVGPQLGAIWDEEARVADPTFRQYGYNKNCQTTLDYLWTKVNSSKFNRVLPFGYCYSLHLKDISRGHVPSLITAVGITTTNNTVYREIARLGGPSQFLVLADHKNFVNIRQEVLGALRQDLMRLREDIDRVAWSHPTTVLVQRMLGEVGQRISLADCEVMAAYYRMTNPYAGLHDLLSGGLL